MEPCELTPAWSLAPCADYYPSRGFVRGVCERAGYVFRATADPQVWQLSYVVQIDPKGLLPKFIVNLVARDQAGTAGRMCAARVKEPAVSIGR